MDVPAQLTLVVPGCCGPLPEKTTVLDHLEPRLHQLDLWKYLSRANKKPAAQNFHQQLAILFDHSPAAQFPYAALDLLGEGGEPGNTCWLHADPVCMQADMDHAILFDAHSLHLADHEADQLITELNTHFSQDGIELHRGSVSNWYMTVKPTDSPATTPLHDVVGRNVNLFMPTGDNASVWKRFMNEAQMLLHMSEVNQQREARGHLPVNSLWLWGEGCLSKTDTVTHKKFDRVLSTNPSARGLAVHHDMACGIAPEEFASVTDSLDQAEHVCLVLDDLFGSISYADVAAWQEQLILLSEHWLQPLIMHCQSKNIPVQIYPCNGTSYALSRSNKFRIWRRGKMQTHLDTHG